MTAPYELSNAQWQVAGTGADKLLLTRAPTPQPGPREVLVRVGAVSLNYKDKLAIEGAIEPLPNAPFIPVSDAAGEIVAVGSEVRRFSPGARVVGHVITDWIDGDVPSPMHTRTLGMTLPGMLARYAILPEEAAVATPPSLTDVEASTLPIAALTAWSALFEGPRPAPGETLLIQGTGGVALFALQFARLAGMRPIVISSSDEKLERARALGAWQGINYRKIPEWDEVVRELTGGRGVNQVLELVGGDNLARSANALAAEGRLSLIGLLGDATSALPTLPLIRKHLKLFGVAVGHRRSFERMNAAVEQVGLKPVIDSVFPFAEAPAAFDRLGEGPFGKIVIDCA